MIKNKGQALVLLHLNTEVTIEVNDIIEIILLDDHRTLCIECKKQTFVMVTDEDPNDVYLEYKRAFKKFLEGEDLYISSYILPFGRRVIDFDNIREEINLLKQWKLKRTQASKKMQIEPSIDLIIKNLSLKKS